MAVSVLAVGAALALGGCQSDEPPPTTPSPSVSSSTASPTVSPSPSPSPTEGEIPAAAREKTEKGGEAFVRYFFDQVNVAWTEPKAGVIARLSEPKCEFCTSTEETAEFLVKEGQRYDKDPVTVASVEPFVAAPEGQLYFYLEGTQNRANILDRSGKVVATDPKKAVAFNVAVKWAGDGWRLFGVEDSK